MTDRELMQKVFKAIDSANDSSKGSIYAGVFDYEIKLLKDRLAQPEPEPVAYMDMFGQVYNPAELDGVLRIKYLMQLEDAPTPLYYAPIPYYVDRRQWRFDPATGQPLEQSDLAKVGAVGVWGERQWQSLTDEEIQNLKSGLAFARAIEAKLREKNTLRERDEALGIPYVSGYGKD